jgi:esterase/lipase
VRNDTAAEPQRNDQRREQLTTTALTAWDLQRSRQGRAADARTRLMLLRTHERLRLLEEAELGVPKHQRSFLKAGDTGRPAVLLIHDAHQGPAQLVPLAQTLNRAGLTVYGLLLSDYGHGQEERPQARWRAALQQLRRGHGLLADTCGQVHVVGVGFGAALALHLAERERVAGLVLIAPDLMPRVSVWVRLLWSLRLLRVGAVRRRLGRLVDATEAMRQAQELAGKLKLPIFGVQSDDDDHASPQSLRLLQKRARHANSRFQALHGGGHELLQSPSAAPLEQDILRFITDSR